MEFVVGTWQITTRLLARPPALLYEVNNKINDNNVLYQSYIGITGGLRCAATGRGGADVGGGTL